MQNGSDSINKDNMEVGIGLIELLKVDLQDALIDGNEFTLLPVPLWGHFRQYHYIEVNDSQDSLYLIGPPEMPSADTIRWMYDDLYELFGKDSYGYGAFSEIEAMIFDGLFSGRKYYFEANMELIYPVPYYCEIDTSISVSVTEPKDKTESFCYANMDNLRKIRELLMDRID